MGCTIFALFYKRLAFTKKNVSTFAPNMGILNFFRTLFKKKQRSDWWKLEEVREGWYKYKNELEMPSERLQALQIAELGLDWNVGKEQLTEIITKVIDLIIANKMQDAILKLSALKEKVNLILSREMIVEICSIFFVYKDEPINKYSKEWTLKKSKMLNEDRDLANFFLRYYLQSCKNLEVSLVTDSLNYLFAISTENLRINKVLNR